VNWITFYEHHWKTYAGKQHVFFENLLIEATGNLSKQMVQNAVTTSQKGGL
jgi:hypothetical protein